MQIDLLKNSEKKQTRVIQFDLYNANRQMVYVNPFAKEFEKNSGAIQINESPVFENGVLIRLDYLNIDFFDFLTRPIYLNDKKVNISSYFSANQFQSGIVDIPFGFKLSELDLKIPLCFMEHCVVSFYEGESKNTIHENNSYALIENNSMESVSVNLIDLFKNENVNKNIKVINSNFTEGRNNYSLMRIWSKNHNQLYMPILDKEKNREIKIEPSVSVSHYNFQPHIIDVSHEIDLSKTESIETIIMPKTKIMFHIL